MKAGQKVMVLKSPKGIYMQLESGKIIAIRTSANNKSNNQALPSQSYNPQQQPTQTPPVTHIKPPPLENFSSGPKNGVYFIILFNIYNMNCVLKTNFQFFRCFYATVPKSFKSIKK